MRIYIAVIVLLAIAITNNACEKKDVLFGASTLSEDPNIVAINTVTPVIYTYHQDSFSTKGTSVFIAGTHYDSIIGSFTSTAYFDFAKPYDSTKTLYGCTSCIYDSIVFQTKMNGGYYGDTTSMYTLNINRLTQRLLSDSGALGYNTGSFRYNASPLGNFTATVSPAKQSVIRVLLSNDFGLDLYNKIKSNSDSVTDADLFLKYFNGIALTATGNVAYYMKPVNDSSVLQLYYHKNAPVPASYVVKIPYSSANQFNGFTYDKSSSILSVFTPKKEQLLSINETGGFTVLNPASGLTPKISFPSLYSLKEISSYINIVSATLEIYPYAGTYGMNTFYPLPGELNLYTTDEFNSETGSILDAASSAQTGNLSVDYLYNTNTKYTYDITSYLTSVLTAGKYSTSALLLRAPAAISDSTNVRLILNRLKSGNSVQLKLNVLGL